MKMGEVRGSEGNIEKRERRERSRKWGRGGAGGEVWVGEKNGRKIRKENGLEANFEIYEWIMIS